MYISVSRLDTNQTIKKAIGILRNTKETMTSQFKMATSNSHTEFWKGSQWIVYKVKKTIMFQTHSPDRFNTIISNTQKKSDIQIIRCTDKAVFALNLPQKYKKITLKNKNMQ